MDPEGQSNNIEIQIVHELCTSAQSAEVGLTPKLKGYFDIVEQAGRLAPPKLK